MPAVLERALSDLQKAIVQDHPKRFRQLGKSLVRSLKMRSLSKHRGGLQPNFYDLKRSPRAAFRGRNRQEEKRALKALAEFVSLSKLEGDPESLQRALKSHPSYSALQLSAEEDRLRAKTRGLAPTKLYNGLGALAYATARLPSAHAAVKNVFQRLKMSQKDIHWAPQTMLDFGAGPGTAAWAAQSVWPSARICVTNVEGSPSMADIGHQLTQLIEENRRKDKGEGVDRLEDDTSPEALDVRWVRGLPRDHVKNKYDICVASYSLNEINGSVGRHQLLNRLMRSAKEYIVLIEHGTPHGFSIIEDSRRYILKVSRKLGIPFHVAAPCPHDGPCPLREKRAWCHFSQRHIRTVEQRVAVKSLTGKAPRDTYAERFSYVVLKRGLRDDVHRSTRDHDRLLQTLGAEEQAGRPFAQDTGVIGNELQDIAHIQDAMLQRIRNSRILRRRKRKGHVMLDLCSVLDVDGKLTTGDAGTILRQTISKGKSKSSWDAGAAYKAGKALSQGDEWPLVFQITGNAIESPVLEENQGNDDDDDDDDDLGDLASLFEDSDDYFSDVDLE